MRIRGPLVLTLATLAAGCGSNATATGPAATGAHRGTPYTLLTHCGIEWAKIDGTFWRATRPLSDGSGNPPPGWGNPSQQGTLTFTNRTTAEFDSPAGKVTFKRTDRKQPPFLCA
jgi:hypothetical protein